MKRIVSLLFILILISCKADPNDLISVNSIHRQLPIKTVTTTPIHTGDLKSIAAPKNFTIQEASTNSYAHYLQTLPLKPKGSKIKYYDGRTKGHFSEYVAVIDLPIGTKDLHQCADAVMRLRADYLWHTEQFDKIHFNFTNGMRIDYNNWMQGQRIKVVGNNTTWYQAKEPSNTPEDYWNYLEQIWMYAGTLSLSKELTAREIKDIQIGDVFIQGGSPGHAISIVNMAVHNITGEQLILLAQSYMPAQETHILTNPYDSQLSPWYSVKDLDELRTPEWTFNASDLMYFDN